MKWQLWHKWNSSTKTAGSERVLEVQETNDSSERKKKIEGSMPSEYADDDHAHAKIKVDNN